MIREVLKSDLTKSEIAGIPGRGLVTRLSTEIRLKHLENLEIQTDQIAQSGLALEDIQKNIESYIGSVEIPVGIVGPLVYQSPHGLETVYTAAATLEGALISSMNRGARAISLSGGFRGEVIWQKMSRAPMFIFGTEEEAAVFCEFQSQNFNEIKKLAESYSNHAHLIEIDCIKDKNAVHLVFFYQTGDASGQNMITTCTWHAMLFVADRFSVETGIKPLDFIIDGNGSCDKKNSRYSEKKGRGVRVKVTCSLTEKVINEVLRTSSEKMMCFYEPSLKLARQNEMTGYNINVANALAAIFAATGQDLACVHESSPAVLTLQKTLTGLDVTLEFTNLVIGTVGGGTHLPKQSQALEMMGCKGSGKIKRFACLVAGFALGLDISTYAAIVSGEFAKAHEKLGRNKPVDCLLRSELTSRFLLSCIDKKYRENYVEVLVTSGDQLLENGILTSITSRVCRKLIGFVPLTAIRGDEKLKLLLKSKATDLEVIKGLHIMAASVDPILADLINCSKAHLEYMGSHLKEPHIYEFLDEVNFKNIPTFYGKMVDPAREIFLFIQEYLDHSQMLLVNTENQPELWKENHIRKVIETAVSFHRLFENAPVGIIPSLNGFEPWKSQQLYFKLLDIIDKEEMDEEVKTGIRKLKDELLRLEERSSALEIKHTLVHNDFNTRNLALRSDGEPVIYDWELAVIGIPHRDICEFLCFVLPEDFTELEINRYFEYHHSFYPEYTREAWWQGYRYALLETLICRFSFYEVAGILVKYDFSKRVFRTALRMFNKINRHD